MVIDWKKKIETWLAGQSKWFIDKLWQTVVELKAEQELLGQDTFRIPLERFRKKNLDLDNVKKLLINLHRKEIISVFKELGRTSPSDDPEKPTGSVGVLITDDESIFYDPKTEISLTHGFKYLYTFLEKKQHPEKTQEKKRSRFDKAALDKAYAELIIDKFSQENLPFVLMVLKGIRNAVEFASGDDVPYKLQSGWGTVDLIQERQLLRKFESLKLFGHEGEDRFFGIARLYRPNLALIDKCLESGRQRLAMAEVKRRIAIVEAKKRIAPQEVKYPIAEIKTTQDLKLDALKRKVQKMNEEDKELKLKKVDELDERLRVLEQKTQGKSPTQFVKQLLKQYKFPRKQKRLLKELSNCKPIETNLLKGSVKTSDLASLKRDTLKTIEGFGLSKVLTIKSTRGQGSFPKYFYQLEVYPESFASSQKPNKQT